VSYRSHPSDPDFLVDLLEALAAELFIWPGNIGRSKAISSLIAQVRSRINQGFFQT
jgi:hypothetical protein